MDLNDQVTIFTFKGLTPENNYWLESEDGILLKNSYPRSRLKVVSIIENEKINKIESIKKHRVDKGNFNILLFGQIMMVIGKMKVVLNLKLQKILESIR